MNQNLGEMNANVVIQNRNIIFRPPIEKLKESYFKEVKGFIDFPGKSFTGVGGNSDLFYSMPERNSKFLEIVYSKAEELFAKLNKIIINLNVWRTVAFLENENLEDKIVRFEDWELNIKNLKVSLIFCCYFYLFVNNFVNNF